MMKKLVAASARRLTRRGIKDILGEIDQRGA